MPRHAYATGPTITSHLHGFVPGDQIDVAPLGRFSQAPKGRYICNLRYQWRHVHRGRAALVGSAALARAGDMAPSRMWEMETCSAAEGGKFKVLHPAVRQVVEQNVGAIEALGSTPQAYTDAVEQGEDGRAMLRKTA